MRIATFLATLASMILLESLWPRRALFVERFREKGKRWLQHLLFVSGGQAALYVGLGLWGLSPLALARVLEGVQTPVSLATWPFEMRLLFEVLLLDLVIYGQHRLFHIVPMFWRFHRVHHSDPQLDASSALRFHPVEIVISGAVKSFVVWFFGVSVLGVFLFEILLSSLAIFNHTNLSIPKWLESILSTVVITPDIHRVHHHRYGRGRFCNFGFQLTLWDKIFGTLMRVDDKTQLEAELGLSELPASPEPQAWDLARQPFRRSEDKNV